MAIKGVLIPTAVSAPLSNKCPEICLTTQVQSNGTEIYCYEGKAWLWANTSLHVVVSWCSKPG